MKAIVVDRNRPGRPLLWQEVADPSCGEDDVIVDVQATALNRADLLHREGNFPTTAGRSDLLGGEAAGRIREVGNAVRGWSIGDSVVCLTLGGGYAEQVRVPQRLLMPVPTGLSIVESAALPEAYLTAYANLFINARLEAGETVLIHSGASGVGTAAIQLARLAGCRVVVTVGSAEKARLCEALGADLAIRYHEEDFVARALEFGGGEGVDVILDTVGGAYLERNLELLALKGRLLLIGILGGTQTEINMRQIISKRLAILGDTLSKYSVAELADMKDAFLRDFGQTLDDGRLKPVVDSVFPIQEAERAHQRMAENKNVGKIILTVREH